MRNILNGCKQIKNGIVGIAKGLYHGDKGQTATGAIMLVSGSITIFIGILVVSEIYNNINRSNFTTVMNTTFVAVLGFTMTGFLLLGISLIVLGAAIILGYVQMLSGGGMRIRR
jgi:hypothetical protein